MIIGLRFRNPCLHRVVYSSLFSSFEYLKTFYLIKCHYRKKSSVPHPTPGPLLSSGAATPGSIINCLIYPSSTAKRLPGLDRLGSHIATDCDTRQRVY